MWLSSSLHVDKVAWQKASAAHYLTLSRFYAYEGCSVVSHSDYTPKNSEIVQD